MKKSIVVTVMAAFAAVFSFTSCNTEGSTFEWPNKTEANTIMQAVAGSNSGKMIYYKVNPDNVKDYVDTLSYIGWNITPSDSVLTVHDFPVSILSEYVTNNDALKAAVAAADPQDLKAKCVPFSVSNYTFLINPTALTTNLTYGGATHKVQFVFYTGSNYSYGKKTAVSSTSTSTVLTMQILLGAIYIDGNKSAYLNYTVNNYSVTPQFYFIGTK